MKKRTFLKKTSLSVIAVSVVFVVGFQVKPHLFDIPKTWDMAEIEQFILPTTDGHISVTPISEAYYYKLPERKIFKSYPI